MPGVGIFPTSSSKHKQCWKQVLIANKVKKNNWEIWARSHFWSDLREDQRLRERPKCNPSMLLILIFFPHSRFMLRCQFFSLSSCQYLCITLFLIWQFCLVIYNSAVKITWLIMSSYIKILIFNLSCWKINIFDCRAFDSQALRETGTVSILHTLTLRLKRTLMCVHQVLIGTKKKCRNVVRGLSNITCLEFLQHSCIILLPIQGAARLRDNTLLIASISFFTLLIFTLRNYRRQ